MRSSLAYSSDARTGASSLTLILGLGLGLAGCLDTTPIGMLSASTTESSGSESGGATDSATSDPSATDSDPTGTGTGTDTDTDPGTDTDTDTGGALCGEGDPEVDAGYSVAFGAWSDDEPLALADDYHYVTVTDECVVASVSVEGSLTITGLECTKGQVDVGVVSPRSGDPAWTAGESVTFDFRSRVEDVSVTTLHEFYVALRRGGMPMVVVVSADDAYYGDLFDPVTVTYEGMACGETQSTGALHFDAPGGGSTSVYDQQRGSLDVDAALILDVDVAEAHAGPCCHVGDTFRYAARAAKRP